MRQVYKPQTVVERVVGYSSCTQQNMQWMCTITVESDEMIANILDPVGNIIDAQLL